MTGRSRPDPRDELLRQLAEVFDESDWDHGTTGVVRSPVPATRSPLVLVIDGEGPDRRLRWVTPSADRADGGTVTFELPPPLTSGAERGVVGAVAKRVVKLMLPKLAGAAVAKGVELAAARWEASHHVESRLRAFTPETNHLDAQESTEAPPLAAGDRPALLLVPDVLGSARSSFAGLRGLPASRLAARYDDRILAFEHFTLSRTPAENAADLHRHLLDHDLGCLDILAHGRGGLVARELVTLVGPDGAGTLGIHRLVTAGTPHSGTPLCDPNAIAGFLDRCSDLLSFLPLGGIDDVIVTIVGIAQVVATSAAKGLPGLTAMGTTDERLAVLNRAQTAFPIEMVAIGSDFRGGTDDGWLKHFVGHTAALAFGQSDGIVSVDSATAARLQRVSRLTYSLDEHVGHHDYSAAPETVGALTIRLDAGARSGGSAVGAATPEGGNIARVRRGPVSDHLDISVAHAGLEYARFPVMVGNFDRSTLGTTQSILDDRLDGRLSALLAVDAYPGLLGESYFARNNDGIGYPPGAYIVGLGREGDLDVDRLAYSVRQALLGRCLALFDDPQHGAEVTVGVSSLLLGSYHSTGLTVSDAVFGIVDGVRRANKALALYGERLKGGRVVRVGALQFVERAAERAEAAVVAVRDACHQFGLDRSDDRACVSLEALPDRGGMPALLRADEVDRPDVQLTVVAADETPAPGSGTLAVEISMVGAGAGAPRWRHELDTALVGVLSDNLARGIDTEKNGRTLFQLLLPAVLDESMSFAAPMQLVVDTQTANIPWELLTVPLTRSHADSLASLGGVVRRFAEREATRLAPMRAPTVSALVIGAGRVAGQAPLAGALAEADAVQQILHDHCTAAHGTSTMVSDSTAPLDAADTIGLFLGEHRYVHVASHGTFEDDGRTAAALLGPGLRLTPGLVAAMRTVPEVVFLNCCKLAGVGSQRFAPGIARQLMAIGVRAVVAAGWNIADDAAVAFASTFWTSLTQGEPFGQAVRRARRDAAERGGGNTWAAYQCYGDPNLRIASRRHGATALDPPLSTADVVRQLQALAVRATDIRGHDLDGVVKRLAELQQELRLLCDIAGRRNQADDAEVQRNVGFAARQLGMFATAVEAYRRAVAKPGNEHARDLEQLANVEARLAQRLAHGLVEHDEITDDALRRQTVDQLFRSALGHIDKALKLSPSRERHGIKGSIYKKWATVVPAGDERKAARIAKAVASYGDAVACDPDRPYGLQNALQLATLVPGSVEPAEPAPGPPDTEPLLVDARQHTAGFWDLADLGDRALTLLMRSGAEAEGLARRAALSYLQAFENRSSVAERDSVIVHIYDMVDLVDPGSAQHAALLQVRTQLEPWDPWAQVTRRFAEPQAAAAAAMATGGSTRRAIEGITVRMMPAGPGDALVVSWGPPTQPFTMLIDGGLALTPDEGLGAYLRDSLGNHVDLLVVSHIDADHVRGAIDAVSAQRLTYGDVWFNGGNELVTDRSVAQGRRFDGLTLGQNRNTCVAGRAIVVPAEGPLPTTTLAHGVRITFLSPDGPRLERLKTAWERAPLTRGDPQDDGFDELALLLAESELPEADAPERGGARTVVWGGDTSVPNGSSIAFLLEYGAVAMLFTGDAYSEVLTSSLQRLIEDRGLNRLRLDLFKVSHHGSTNNLSHQLLDMIECDHFLVSTDGSRHGHPVPDAIDLIHRKHPTALIHVHDTPAVRQRAGDGDHVVYVTADSIAFEG